LLAHHGIAFEARDIFRRPLSDDEIRGLTRHAPVEALVAWRSPTARARGLQPGSLSEDALVSLMASEPRLIRRPLVLAGDRLIIGADGPAIAALAS
jgi:arsenate reductase-like glutaredoxin family protein